MHKTDMKFLVFDLDLRSLYAVILFLGVAQSQLTTLGNTGADSREYNLSEGPGGSCKIVVSNRCCTKERVVKQLQRVQCECKVGYSAGTTRAKASCVPDSIKREGRWCDMTPCLDDETCSVSVGTNGLVQGWQCIKGDQIKTIKVTE